MSSVAMKRTVRHLAMVAGMLLMLAGCSDSTGDGGWMGAQEADGRNAYMTSAGLQIQIQWAYIASDGMVMTNFEITDGQGTPLDINGEYTEGAVDVHFVLAWLGEDAAAAPAQYTPYTTEDRTSPITSTTAPQPVPDAVNDFLEIEAGTYACVFAAPAQPANSSRTHTILAYATRVYEGRTYTAAATYDFVPAGGAVAAVREVVTTDACNVCHGELRAHAGTFRDTRQCVICHTADFIDPDTGNTLDLRVMIHKIHSGRALPSVAAGTPYQMIGASQTVKDFSQVLYPQELQRCIGCHGGARDDYWRTRPGRDACGSCHDLISFRDPVPAGMILHGGGTQPDDAPCGVCHPLTGSLAGIIEKHRPPLLDPGTPVLTLSIVDVANTNPGQTPTVTFEVNYDGAPRDILTAPLDYLRATVAGPTTDYETYWQSTIQGTGAAGTLTAVDAAGGVFAYTFPAGAGIPADAAGSYALGLEGYVNLWAGGPRNAAVPPVAFFSVTDPAAVPRRQVVSDAACKACHTTLWSHGHSRPNVQYCAFCHNHNTTNSDYAARFEGSDVLARSMDLKVVIHKIHRGVDLIEPYLTWMQPRPTAGNPGGTPADYDTRPYSADLRNCAMCHLPSTFGLPLPDGIQPSTESLYSCSEDPAADADDYCTNPNWFVNRTDRIPPVSAVCTSCHDNASSVAHAEENIFSGGPDSCETCHAPGSEFGIDMYHAVAP